MERIPNRLHLLTDPLINKKINNNIMWWLQQFSRCVWSHSSRVVMSLSTGIRTLRQQRKTRFTSTKLSIYFRTIWINLLLLHPPVLLFYFHPLLPPLKQVLNISSQFFEILYRVNNNRDDYKSLKRSRLSLLERIG